MKAILMLAAIVAGWPAQAAPLKHVLAEGVTGPTYIKGARTLHKWQVQDFTLTCAAGAILVGFERDARGGDMCYAITDYDKFDAVSFAVRVHCANIN